MKELLVLSPPRSEAAGSFPCDSSPTTTRVGRETTATVATDAGCSVRSGDATITSGCAPTFMTGESEMSHFMSHLPCRTSSRTCYCVAYRLDIYH